MNRDLFAIALALALFVVVVALTVPSALSFIIVVIVGSAITILLIRKYVSDSSFVTKVFLLGLAARLIFGLVIFAYDLQQFFGGDALTFDYKGTLIFDYWQGNIPADMPELLRATTTAGPGWGMHYFVAAIYWVVGKNLLVAQTIAAIFGAATIPLVYSCAHKLFGNKQVSRLASLGIAIFPAFVIWSGQLLKDGLIIFLLVLAMSMVLTLQEKFSYAAIVLLILSLGGIISLRFYIFYMVAAAIAGSLVIGTSNSTASILRRAALLVVVGLSLTYLGVIRTASVDFEKYGDLDRLQNSRLDQATSADSGYADDIDVSTTEGAISAIPIGFIYLFLAPFPWEVRNLRQAITLPEVFAWWAMIPLMIWGIWFAVKNKLRTAFPILIFSGMLTLAYSIFQSNVGTAYRQRTQIQVFLFMFIAVGWVLYKERKEDRKIMNRLQRNPSERIFDDQVEALN